MLKDSLLLAPTQTVSHVHMENFGRGRSHVTQVDSISDESSELRLRLYIGFLEYNHA